MKVINLYGGPGSRKSTIAAQLFAEMKFAIKNVELVTEFAKDIVWDENFKTLSDQLYISANQNRKLFRLKDKVDWAITDSPILLGMMYRSKHYLPDTYDKLLLELYATYNNINIFIKRDKPYVATGRVQTFEKAKEKDEEIKLILKSYNIPFEIITGNKFATRAILKLIN